MTMTGQLEQLDQTTMWRALTEAGLPVCDYAVSSDDAEVLDICGRIGYPVVLKAVTSAHAHKTEGGGVLVNLADRRSAEDALGRLRLAFSGPVDILVQRYLPTGRELLVSAMRTPAFGSVAALGLGGIHTETLSRVAFRLAPVSLADVRDVLLETGLTSYAGDTRGMRAVELSALTDCVNATVAVLEQLDAATVVELNPVHVGNDGQLTVVDCRIISQHPGGTA